MGQNNLGTLYGKSPSGTLVPVLTDAGGNLTVNIAEQLSSHLDITAATVVKATSGFVGSISVLVAGNATGTINDCATTGAVTITNQIFTIPDTAGVYAVNWPTSNGIVVTPGTGGQTVAITYE